MTFIWYRSIYDWLLLFENWQCFIRWHRIWEKNLQNLPRRHVCWSMLFIFLLTKTCRQEKRYFHLKCFFGFGLVCSCINNILLLQLFHLINRDFESMQLGIQAQRLLPIKVLWAHYRVVSLSIFKQFNLLTQSTNWSNLSDPLSLFVTTNGDIYVDNGYRLWILHHDVLLFSSIFMRIYIVHCWIIIELIKNGRIQLFRLNQRNGSTKLTIKLIYPTGIVLDGDQYLFIVDANNDRIIGSDECHLIAMEIFMSPIKEIWS